MKRKAICLILAVIVGFSAPKDVAAESLSAVVIEAETGRILYENNANQRLPMASTTKIMTAVLAIEEGNLDDVVKVKPSAVGVEGSSMYLREGDEISLGDLIVATLFVSANDGAVAIAEHIDGSCEKFVQRMNRKAKQIGCADTNFANVNGLPNDNHYTTAKDLVLIARYAMNNEIFKLFTSSKTYTVVKNGTAIMYRNKNQFLYLYEYALGVKTGYTKAAGRCFVSAAQNNSMTLIGVVLNSSDIYGESRTMMNELFDQYHMCTLAKKGDYMATIPVRGGEIGQFRLTFDEDVRVPVTVQEKEKLQLRIETAESLGAPVNYGDIVGSVYVECADEMILKRNIKMNTSIAKKGEGVRRLFRQLADILEDIFS